MQLRKLAFAGYRSFAARSPVAPERPLQQLQLAPLTILLGKNNSGKSSIARLLHHVLLALGHDGSDPFPMSGGGQTFGTTFRDIQHNGDFFNPLDLDVSLVSEEGAETTLTTQLIQAGDGTDDRLPVIRECQFDGKQVEPESRRVRGLLPDTVNTDVWRAGARTLSAASCRIGPIRDAVRATYDVRPASDANRLPRTNDEVAQLLLGDVELREAVSEWMSSHLEGWRLDVRQSLDVFGLISRRPRREINLAASGQGVQQVLPVVALCYWRALKRGDQSFLDIVEQPELHLHDAAHAALGDLLLLAVTNRRGNVVVETHSESLVLRVRRRVAEGLSPDTVAIYFVEDLGDGSRVRRIPLRPDGEVEWWPEGVFSESFAEVKAIRRAQRARGGA